LAVIYIEGNSVTVLVSKFKTFTTKELGLLALNLALVYSENFLPKEAALILAKASLVCL